MALLKMSFRMRKRYVEEDRRSYIFITKVDHYLNPSMMFPNVDSEDVQELVSREKTYRLRPDRMVFTEMMAQLGRNLSCNTSKDGEPVVIRPNLSEFFDRINGNNDVIAQIDLDIRSRILKLDAGLSERLEIKYGRDDYYKTYHGEQSDAVPEFSIDDFVDILPRDTSADVYSNYDN